MKTKKSASKCDVNVLTQRIWGDTPIVDAKNELRIVVQACDVQGAKRKDPEHCVFARACRRMFGAKKILFYKQVAYVEIPNTNGTKRVERFLLSKDVRKSIQQFDRDGSTLPNGGFVLQPPHASQTLGSRQQRNKDDAVKRDQHRLLFGCDPAVSPRGSIASRKKTSRTIDLSVRNGVGKVRWLSEKRG
jgi:hypothetical protein